MTVLLNASAIEELIVDREAVFEALESGFRQTPQPDDVEGQRVRTDLPANGTATALLPGLLPGVPAYTVKVNAKFPRATPALRGVVCLHSLHDGALLAVLDSASITALRTGLAAAWATDLLAARDATTVGVIGAGTIGRTILQGLAGRRSLGHVSIQDVDHERARALAGHAVGELALEADVVETAAHAARHDIVIVATWSRSPLLRADDARPGQHVTSVGADEPGKQELAADLLDRATLVVDDRGLVERAGATASAGLSPYAIDATLTEVLAGRHPGRSSDDEVTIYSPVGLPWQDLALAWPLYQHARESPLPARFDWLA